MGYKHEYGFPRIRRLNEIYVRKGIRTAESLENGEVITYSSYLPGIKLDIERSILVTESHKKTEGEPEILRRAKAFKHLLENMTIWILPAELIVGNEVSRQANIPVFIEESNNWIDKELNQSYKNMLNDDEKKLMRECFVYWQGKTFADRFQYYLPEDLKLYAAGMAENHILWHMADYGRGRPAPDYDELFKVGLKRVVERCETELDSLKKHTQKDIEPATYFYKRNFYESSIIANRAVIEWAQRYSKLATELSEKEVDLNRREELKKIAAICKWVPENPPRDLYEALQFFYFIHLAQRLELHAQSAGYRFDLLMGPFYKKDLYEGKTTKDEAQELLECLFLKMNDVGELTKPDVAGTAQGSITWQNITIGGTKLSESGEWIDASNEMTLIIIDAMNDCRVRDPNLCLRYHDNLSEKVIDKAVDLIATGHGMPALFNDKVVIPHLTKWYGLSSDVTNNYMISGCVRWGIPGSTKHSISPNIGGLCTLKLLELALNQGVCMLSGKQVGYRTPEPGGFASFEDVKKAYLKQADFFADKIASLWNISETIYCEYAQRPFSSVLTHDGVKRGLDANRITEYGGVTTLLNAGATNVANSLAVIKKLVFDDRELTINQLVDALRKNWEGYEELRQKAINKVPKFGNDDPYVDELMRWVHIETNKQFMQYKDIFGFPYRLGSSIAAGYYGLSLHTAATPDGRKNREPCADASISPAAGTDKKGPTAVLKSASKINPIDSGWDQLLNQRFMPEYINGVNKKIFKSYLKTWSDLPIYHIQFNVVDNEMLKDAQLHPDMYTDLIVRVAGYSAFFVDLPKEVQNDIILRAEQKIY